MPADHDARTSAAARLLCCAALALACKGDAPRPEPQELEAPAPAPRLGSFEPLPGAPTMPDDVAAALAAAWDARPSDYYARTRHLREDGGPRFVNRLFLETSPYLRQHAHNPVNWLPWGEEAFALARALGRPIFLSVGYSTCHWCHVMEEESFEDEEIAAVLNERFIAVKVDREERPDVDGVYMQAVQLMTRRGGWPMTVVMTADKLPFFAATYIPPRDGVRGARRGLLTLLGQLADAHARDPARLVAQGEKIAAELVRQNTPAPPEGVPGPELLTRAVAELAAEFDDIHAGFGPAPKFPPVDDLALLLRYHRRTGDAKALEMATRTLEAMAAGGLHDQIGGGFHRYATDGAWLVPHFEKMLYDNALLVGVYLDAYQITGREEFAAVAGSTLDYLDREMCAGDGFYAATDADSLTPAGAREEGYYFTWAEAEIDAALEGLAPPDIAAVKAHYGVTPGGNFEGRSILHVARPLDALALELSRPREELAALVDDARQRLRRARDERPRPLRDDKLITAWNGLAISAFARGGFLLKREELLFRAVAVASRYDAGPLTRVVVDEAPRGAPVLADHVYLAQGMLDLFEATGQPRWLEAAVRRQAEADARYRDPATGVYYETAVDGEALLVRAIEDFDGATPSGSSIAAHNLLRLAVYQGDEAARERGVAVLRAFARALTARPTSLASLLAALERTLDSPREVAIVHPAPADAAALDALLQPVREVYSPSRALVIVAEPELDDRARAIPWLAGKRPRDGAPTAYVCERGRCEAPTADPATLRRQLAVVAPLPQPGPPDP